MYLARDSSRSILRKCSTTFDVDPTIGRKKKTAMNAVFFDSTFASF